VGCKFFLLATHALLLYDVTPRKRFQFPRRKWCEVRRQAYRYTSG